MFCVSVKVKLTVPLLCVCVHSAWKGRPRNDLYCVGWDVKPYLLTHSLCITEFLFCFDTQWYGHFYFYLYASAYHVTLPQT